MQQDASPETEHLWRRYLSNYLGCMRMIDDQVKRLVEHLERRGLMEKTVFVFTIDHGDSLLKYGIAHKGLDLQENATHTPQIWLVMK
jgi:arylsulfatase A-like enzyme